MILADLEGELVVTLVDMIRQPPETGIRELSLGSVSYVPFTVGVHDFSCFHRNSTDSVFV